MQYIAAPVPAIALAPHGGVQYRSCQITARQENFLLQIWYQHSLIGQVSALCAAHMGHKGRTKMRLMFVEGELKNGQHVHTIALSATRAQIISHPFIIPHLSKCCRLTTVLKPI